MKRILLLIVLALTAQTIKAQAVVLDSNGVTIKWTGTTVPSPRFVQASPRGTLEWFAIVDNTTKVNITDYAKNIQSGITYFTPSGSLSPIPFNNIVTTLVTEMSYMFTYSTITNPSYTPLSFNQPIGSWDVSKVTNMRGMFTETSFNQPLGSWDVSSVVSMDGMFTDAFAFNQPIGSWDVSNVTDMSLMFYFATAFNQPIDSWNVSNVTKMSGMFCKATAFNQPIGSWNVSSVTSVGSMFTDAFAFNQPIGSWDVSNVTYMGGMFVGAFAFNQPIGSWNVSKVINMGSIFREAYAFNQPLDSWNVSNVTNMSGMFGDAGLSSANYDATLIGWAARGANGGVLKQGVTFDGGTSNYCNASDARNYLINTYGWIITDGGSDCTGLNTEEFDTSSLKLYPNPVLNVLNIKVDYNLINQPYNVFDSLGRVVLKGKLNEGDTTINVEHLSKGIYYLKVSDKNASKFIKE